ncbi:hypothetical protein HDU83_009162 [Entophlyctis luteolus]|nr:hypothetical protein HDU83_009162 [Entophlyctis luteolus]
MLVDEALQQVTHLTCLVVGAPASGKSSLIRSFAGLPFDAASTATTATAAQPDAPATNTLLASTLVRVGRILVTVVEIGGGVATQPTLLAPAARDCDCLLAVYDLGRLTSFAAVLPLIERVEAARGCVLPTMLVGTMVDTLHPTGRPRQVKPEQGKQLAMTLGIPFRETSAKAKQSVHSCFAELIATVEELYRNNRLASLNISDEPNRPLLSVLSPMSPDSPATPGTAGTTSVQSITGAGGVRSVNGTVGALDLVRQWRQRKRNPTIPEPEYESPRENFQRRSSATNKSAARTNSLFRERSRPATPSNQASSFFISRGPESDFPDDDERFFVSHLLQLASTDPKPARPGSLRNQRDLLLSESISAVASTTGSTLVYSAGNSPGMINQQATSPPQLSYNPAVGSGTAFGNQLQFQSAKSLGLSVQNLQHIKRQGPDSASSTSTGGYNSTSSANNATNFHFNNANTSSRIPPPQRPSLAAASFSYHPNRNPNSPNNMDSFLASAESGGSGANSAGASILRSTTPSATVERLETMLAELDDFQRGLPDFYSFQNAATAGSSERDVSNSGEDNSEFFDEGEQQQQRVSTDEFASDVSEADEQLTMSRLGRSATLGTTPQDLTAEAARVAVLKSVLGNMDEQAVLDLVRRYGGGGPSEPSDRRIA